MTAELIIGFWFGIGVILAIRMLNSLDYCVEALINKVTARKITEQTQIQQVTTKDPKKVEAGKRMAEWNRQNRKAQKSKSKTKLTYYSAGVVVAIRVLGESGYYVYQSKTPKETLVHQTNETLVQWPKETPANKSEMD